MKPPVDAQMPALLSLINANWTTQAVGVAAALGLPDAIAEAPLDASALAQRVGCDAPSLRRLLEALAALRICRRDAEGRYVLCARGEALRREARPSLRAWAIYNALHAWQPWGGLIDAVRSGRSAREIATGERGYEHLQSPELARVFHEAMEELTALVAPRICEDAIFRHARSVIDVGGGHGQLLIALLRANPGLHGEVYDLPHAQRGALAAFEAGGVRERAGFRAGSFFRAVPPRADVYVLKSILHNWAEDDALRLLARCREAMDSSTLVIVERILSDAAGGDGGDLSNYRSDLNMMVRLGGRERTIDEMKTLLGESGFRLARRAAIGFGFELLEAAPG